MRSVLHAAMGVTVASLLLLGDGPVRAQQTIGLADVAELSGSGASVGTLWRDAVHMAADELNAKGGILGQKIEITDYDTQTSPSVSRAMIQKALDDHPYAILGPIYSGSVRLTCADRGGQGRRVHRRRGRRHHPHGQRLHLPHRLQRREFGAARGALLANDLHAKKVAVLWVNDDAGKSTRNRWCRRCGNSAWRWPPTSRARPARRASPPTC